MKNVVLIAFCFLTFGIAFAQEEELSIEEKERREKNIQAGNPFAEFGYKAKVATLSNGKYLEVHDLDSIVKIGSSLWHVRKQKIVGNMEQDTTDMYRQPLFETAGRWLSPDPLAEEFPEWSPYNYTMNNPIRFTDPTGLAPEDCCNGIIPGSWLGTAGYTLKRTSEVVSRKLSGESWASAYANTYKNDAKNVVRYGTPVEDMYGVIMGKDFDGSDYNRAEAGGWTLASFVPFAKLGKGFKALKTLKYSDDVGGLIQSTGKFGDNAKEIFSFTKSGNFKDARTVANDLVNLGDNAIDYISTTGKGKNPFYGKAVGKQSANGKSGYRIDWSEDAGAHINWWNGKQKGAIPFSGGLDQAKRIINNEVIK